MLSFSANETATTEIYTLSLHDALPISPITELGALELDKLYKEKDRMKLAVALNNILAAPSFETWLKGDPLDLTTRSEEHTSELQSRRDLVCRLLLEKKKFPSKTRTTTS